MAAVRSRRPATSPVAGRRAVADRRWRAADFQHYQRSRRGDRGSSAIELAILLPTITFALFASIQVALIYLANETAQAAAQQGVTAQRAYGVTGTIGKTKALQFLADNDSWITDGEVTRFTDTGAEVTITVEGNAIALVPFGDFHVIQTAHGSKERTTAP